MKKLFVKTTLGLAFLLSGCVSVQNPIVFTLINDVPKKNNQSTEAVVAVDDEIKKEPPATVNSAPPAAPASGVDSPANTSKDVLTMAPIPSDMVATITLPSTVTEDFRKRPEVIAYVNEVLKSQRTCSGFKLPVIPAVPEITRKELESINRNDPKAVQELLKKHIRELYTYSTNWKNQVEESYARYRKKCR